MSKWGFVASVLVGLLTAGLVAVAWAGPVNDAYLGLSKTVPQGASYNKLITTYSCNVPPVGVTSMVKFSSRLSLPFVNTPCDELGTSGTITTTWTVLLRSGTFGTHSGSFTWTEGADVIKGSMAGTVGCGTHRAPLPDCELCRDPLHFEGRLTGTFVSGPTFNFYHSLGLPAPTISATYAGQYLGPTPTPDQPTTAVPVLMNIDGVYSVPCGAPPG
jgi:hypothetical protein